MKGWIRLYTLDYQSRVPIYEQLKNQVTRFALFGILKPNEKLPAVRSLAQQLAINPNTVQKAYQLLEFDGVIYSIPGKGSFVSQDLGANNVRKEKAETELKAAANSALNVGVLKQRALNIVDEVYGIIGGSSHD